MKIENTKRQGFGGSTVLYRKLGYTGMDYGVLNKTENA
jgi:hypothetical protein